MVRGTLRISGPRLFGDVFLGPIGFFFFFVPASIIGVLHLAHFNWSTHNAFSPVQDFKPVNLLGTVVGIYRRMN